jgi:hypothetical protein
MILRPIWADPLVASFPVDPGCVLEPGRIGGLIEINGEIFVTVSDGTNIPPLGIIDDARTCSFTGTVIDEQTLIVAPVTVNGSGVMISTADVVGALNEENIVDSSFAANLPIVLNPKKGLITIPAGTPINYEDTEGNRGFEVISSYRYKKASLPGSDTVDASGMISIHFKRGIFHSDQIDTLSTYSPGCALYVSPEGLLTSQETGSVAVAITIQPPTAINSEIMFMWL